MTDGASVKQRRTGTPTADDVSADLARKVAADGLAPGDRIGSERELADRYGVSRWIVRKALATLENDGVITQTNGRTGGVFVAHKKVVRDLGVLEGLPQYLRTQGFEAGTAVLGTRMVPADDDLSRELELPTASWVLQVDRLRLAAGLPLSVESVWLPAHMFPGLFDHSLVGSIYELLESEYRIERGEAVETIEAVAAAADLATALQVAPGTPVLKVSRTARLASGEVFDFGREFYRADRISIVVPTAGKQHARRRITDLPQDT